MMLLLGRIYRKRLGVYNRAQPLLERAMAQRMAMPGRNTEAVAASMAELARLWQVKGRPGGGRAVAAGGPGDAAQLA